MARSANAHRLFAKTVATAIAIAACKGGDGAYEGIAGDPCQLGTARSGATACVVPSAPEEEPGRTDWSRVALVPLGGACERDCAFAKPKSVQLAQRATDAHGIGLEVRVALDGAANDPNVRYVLELAPAPPRTSHAHDEIVLGPGPITYLKSGSAAETQGDPPWRVSMGDRHDTIDAWIARAIMPANHAVAMVVRVERRDGERWREVLRTAAARACWDAFDLRLDPCGAGR